MILPIFLYGNKIFITATRTHKTKIENILSRGIKVVNKQTNITSLPSVNNIKKKRCAIEVFEYFNGLAPTRFSAYFTKLSIAF